MNSTLDKLIRKFDRFIVFATGVIFIIIVGASLYATNQILQKNLGNRALLDLHYVSREQVSLINDRINNQFARLHFLVQNFMENEMLFRDGVGVALEALRISNQWTDLGFADLAGNAVDSKGKNLGNVSGRQFFKELMTGAKAQTVEYTRNNSDLKGDKRLLFAISVYKGETPKGVLFCSVPARVLEKVMMGTTRENSIGQICVTNSWGEIIFSNEGTKEHFPSGNFFVEHLNGEYLDDMTEAKLLSQIRLRRGGEYVFLHGEKEFTVFEPLGVNDWYLFCVRQQHLAEAMSAEEHQGIRRVIDIMMYAFSALLFFEVILSVVVFRACRKFIEMSKKEIERETASIAKLNEELKDSRIKNSISQMQPHFLYNALGSIREIVLDDPEYAAELIYDFTTHLRACVRSMSNNDMVPFSEELRNIQAYVNIEKMRFGEKLKIQYEINDEDFMIVPLSVQPLVENAIRHGIYPKGAKGGTVTVRTFKEDGRHVIEVMDDGVGFDFDGMLKEIAERKRDSTGMVNLKFRLEKILGASLVVRSSENEGTDIRIEIPDTGKEKQL